MQFQTWVALFFLGGLFTAWLLLLVAGSAFLYHFRDVAVLRDVRAWPVGFIIIAILYSGLLIFLGWSLLRPFATEPGQQKSSRLSRALEQLRRTED